MSILPIILFLFILIAILFGAHWFLYFSLVNFFNISEGSQKILIGFLIFLGLSFIISSFLSRISENIFTRGYYSLSGIWLGVLNNLFWATILVWLIILAGRFLNWPINSVVLASILFTAAIFISIYGIWNAMHPQLKNITVSISNLPASWKGKKIIQLSDVHLGQINRENFLDSIVQKINSVHPEMILITGDLFDGMDGDLSSFIKPLENIQAPEGTFFITGNHETYLGLDNVFRTLKNTSIKIIDDQVVDIDGLKLIGISYPDRSEQKNIPVVLESLKNNYFGSPNILMYHSPTNISEIKNLGINLELCGHTHDGQILPFNLITKLVYHGYNYGLYPMGNYTLYTTNGAGTWGPAMRIGNKPEVVVITLE
jgi:uncharacterized protein